MNLGVVQSKITLLKCDRALPAPPKMTSALGKRCLGLATNARNTKAPEAPQRISLRKFFERIANGAPVVGTLLV